MSSASWNGDSSNGNAPPVANGAQIIQPPNGLRSRLGARMPKIDPDAIAKAEAALQSLSSQFGAWLQDEVAKIEAARAGLHAEGMNQAGIDKVYAHAHDLKGLGATYGFPLVTRIAASLCNLLGDATKRTEAPLVLVYAHVDAVHLVVRDDMRDSNDARGRILAEQLEQGVTAYLA